MSPKRFSVIKIESLSDTLPLDLAHDEPSESAAAPGCWGAACSDPNPDEVARPSTSD